MLNNKPRTNLSIQPTPLEPLNNLSRLLRGPKIYIKRDDCTGLATGGNKARKLEFLVGEALARGATHLLTVGALQSNHVRQTAAAAARVGLKCLALLEDKVEIETDSYKRNGNRLLNQMLGAEVRVYPRGTDMPQALKEAAASLESDGFKPYLVPMGGSNAIGNLGYVACAQEIMSQADEMNLSVDHIVVTTGSAGTHAGLLAGLLAMGRETKVQGISIMGTLQSQTDLVSQQLKATLEEIGAGSAFDASAIQINDRYVGSAYGIPTEAGMEAIAMLARLEAILLDPVYTGKAMSGLIDLINQGHYKSGENIVFLHTGGQAGLFAYLDQLVG